MFEITKQKPKNTLRMLDLLRRDIDSFDGLFDEISHFHGIPTIGGIPIPSFSPSLDIVVKKNEYVTSVELPGMSQEDIEVSIDEDSKTLIIKGEKKQEKKQENDDYYVCERNYGSFRREILLPKYINNENISAEFKNGILKLTLPKEKEKEKEKKKINIST